MSSSFSLTQSALQYPTAWPVWHTWEQQCSSFLDLSFQLAPCAMCPSAGTATLSNQRHTFNPNGYLLILENEKWNSCLEDNFIIRLKRLKYLTYSISWCVLTNSSSLKSFLYFFLLGNLNLSPFQKLLYSLPSTYFTKRQQSIRPTISTAYNFHYTLFIPSSELKGTQTNLLWSLGIYKHI